MKLRFHKMQGCGNDFLFLDSMGDEPPEFYPGEVIHLCDRHYGVGADGLVILHRGKGKADAAWTFYNCDGSEAEMCGNAARCAVRYLAEKHFPGDDPISLETKAGVIKGKYLGKNLVEITMFSQGNLRFEYDEKVIATEKNMFTTFCINTGVPHAVIEVKDILSYPIDQVGRLLVKHPAFGAAGSNVTFFQRLVGNRIRSTTFERGVETETLACGTGATAAAIIYSEQYMQNFPVEVSVPGGDLTIDMSPVSKMLLLRGPADHVFEVDMESVEGNFEQPTPFGAHRRHE